MNNRIRGFEVVSLARQKFPSVPTIIPHRSTERAMAYDFYSKETYTIAPGETHEFATDVKAYLRDDEGLVLNVRSSIGLQGVELRNTQGWVDADFYDNIRNEGLISFFLYNDSDKPVTIKCGERLGQGMFINFLISDQDKDQPKKKREGGLGHTGK